MPRNSSGTYTLPATNNPVVPGTTIQANWANTTLADVAAALTDSASRSGAGGFTAPIRGPDGSAAAPSHSFTGETGSGLYRAGAGDVRLAVAGVDVLSATATGVAVPAGDVALTQAALQGIRKTGGNLQVGTEGATDLVLYTNGVTRFTVGSAGALTSNGSTVTGLPTPSAASDAATKAYVDATDNSGAVAAGADFTISSVKLSKIGGSLVLLRATVIANATIAAGVSATILVIPEGYRPAAAPTVMALLWDSVARTVGACGAQTNGTVTTVSGITSGDIYSFSMAFAI